MDSPIFNSVVNHIKGELERRDLPIEQFKKWQEEAINASGLEIKINLSETTPFISMVEIHIDWDRFREIRLARQLEGMEKHPLLNKPSVPEANVDPNLDVEVTWHFNEQMVLDDEIVGENGGKVETASLWMQGINQELLSMLPHESVSNRWHVEIEGSGEEKYLSSMDLISYFQYPLHSQTEINSINNLVTKKIQQLLLLSNKVVHIAERCFPKVVA